MALLFFSGAAGIPDASAQIKITPNRITKPVWYEDSHQSWFKRFEDQPPLPVWFTRILKSRAVDSTVYDYEHLWEKALRNPEEKPVWVECQTQWEALRLVEEGPVYVEVFADGDIQQVASGSDSTREATSGSLGLLVETKESFYSVNVTVVSDVDTLASVNNLILNPGTGGGAESASISYQKKGKASRGVGWGVYAMGSRSVWATELQSASAFVWGVGGYGAYDAVNATIGENNVGLRGQAGIGLRNIAGDVASDDHDELRKEILGTGKKWFGGLDLSMTVTFRSVSATAQSWVYIGGKADGVTGGQFGARFNVSIPIYSNFAEKRR
jgi:hypothetical protein